MLYLTVCDICWKYVWTNDACEWNFCLHLKIPGSNNIFKVARSLANQILYGGACYVVGLTTCCVELWGAS